MISSWWSSPRPTESNRRGVTGASACATSPHNARRPEKPAASCTAAQASNARKQLYRRWRRAACAVSWRLHASLQIARPEQSLLLASKRGDTAVARRKVWARTDYQETMSFRLRQGLNALVTLYILVGCNTYTPELLEAGDSEGTNDAS